MLKKLTLTIGLLGLSSLVMAQTEVATTQPALHVYSIKAPPLIQLNLRSKSASKSLKVLLAT